MKGARELVLAVMIAFTVAAAALAAMGIIEHLCGVPR